MCSLTARVTICVVFSGMQGHAFNVLSGMSIAGIWPSVAIPFEARRAAFPFPSNFDGSFQQDWRTVWKCTSSHSSAPRHRVFRIFAAIGSSSPPLGEFLASHPACGWCLRDFRKHVATRKRGCMLLFVDVSDGHPREGSSVIRLPLPALLWTGRCRSYSGHTSMGESHPHRRCWAVRPE